MIVFYFADVTDVTEVCVINRYVICERCKLLIPDVDNLDEHVCEAAAVASETDGEMVVELSAKGYQCEYCNKTFAQVIHSMNCHICIIFRDRYINSNQALIMQFYKVNIFCC